MLAGHATTYRHGSNYIVIAVTLVDLGLYRVDTIYHN